VKQAFLTDEELIQVCHNSRANEHLEVKRTEDLIQRRHNISDLRDQITEYIVKCNSCAETRFREIKDMMSNTTKHIKCAMRVSYYELHNKVINIKEFGMRSEIQQYIDYS
jgi:hypothetical protein